VTPRERALDGPARAVDAPHGRITRNRTAEHFAAISARTSRPETAGASVQQSFKVTPFVIRGPDFAVAKSGSRGEARSRRNAIHLIELMSTSGQAFLAKRRKDSYALRMSMALPSASKAMRGYP